MDKVNIGHEVMVLEENEIKTHLPLFTEGLVVKRKNISLYIRDCYENSENWKWGICPDLKYEFYIDELNNCCILFTECLIEEYYDVDLKEDLIVVKIYRCPEDFMASSLASNYACNYLGKNLSSWDMSGYFKTNCSQNNEISIVNTIGELTPSTEIRPNNTL